MTPEINKTPSFGYYLNKWGSCLGYRATAIAYMEREKLKEIAHQNGNSYSLVELKKARIYSH